MYEHDQSCNPPLVVVGCTGGIQPDDGQGECHPAEEHFFQSSLSTLWLSLLLLYAGTVPRDCRLPQQAGELEKGGSE